MNTAIDAQYIGLQASYGKSDFYAELVEKTLEKHAGVRDRKLSILENPGNPIGSTHDYPERSHTPRVILGGGLDGHFAKASKINNLTYLGVRGFLTLNRIPNIDREEICIADLALLTPYLDIESESNHDILYVQTEALSDPVPLREALEEIGAGFVSINDGLEGILNNVKGARLVISDGPIGIAVADSLGVPNVWHKRATDRNVEFQVLDYLSGVRRPLHQRMSVIPRSRQQVEKQTRVADIELVRSQAQSLLTSLKKAHELQILFEPASLLGEGKELYEEPIYTEIPIKGVQTANLEIEYEYAGAKNRRQILVALDLESSNIDLNSVEEIPKLLKSSRPEIGFFRYVSFGQEAGTAEMRIDLPEGIRCRGFRVFRWSDKEARIHIRNLTLHRFD